MKNVEQERKLLKCLLAEGTREPFRWGAALRFLLFIASVAVLLVAKYLILSMPEQALIVLGGVVAWGALVGFSLLYARQVSSARLVRDYLDYERIKARLRAIDTA